MLFYCLWRNVEASCHKHFVVFSRNQHRRLLPATCHNLRAVAVVHRRPCLQHLACCSVKRGSQARYRLRVAISAYSTRIRRPRYGGFQSEYCYAVWYGKTRMACVPIRWWKNFDDMFIRFDTTHERDRQTDIHTQTDTAWRHRPRLCIASRGKNKLENLRSMVARTPPPRFLPPPPAHPSRNIKGIEI